MCVQGKFSIVKKLIPVCVCNISVLFCVYRYLSIFKKKLLGSWLLSSFCINLCIVWYNAHDLPESPDTAMWKWLRCLMTTEAPPLIQPIWEGKANTAMKVCWKPLTGSNESVIKDHRCKKLYSPPNAKGLSGDCLSYADCNRSYCATSPPNQKDHPSFLIQ